MQEISLKTGQEEITDSRSHKPVSMLGRGQRPRRSKGRGTLESLVGAGRRSIEREGRIRLTVENSRCPDRRGSHSSSDRYSTVRLRSPLDLKTFHKKLQ
jgi:hypothetical protein